MRCGSRACVEGCSLKAYPSSWATKPCTSQVRLLYIPWSGGSAKLHSGMNSVAQCRAMKSSTCQTRKMSANCSNVRKSSLHTNKVERSVPSIVYPGSEIWTHVLQGPELSSNNPTLKKKRIPKNLQESLTAKNEKVSSTRVCYYIQCALRFTRDHRNIEIPL